MAAIERSLSAIAHDRFCDAATGLAVEAGLVPVRVQPLKERLYARTDVVRLIGYGIIFGIIFTKSDRKTGFLISYSFILTCLFSEGGCQNGESTRCNRSSTQ